MKSIYFCSSAGGRLFVDNKRSSFKSFIDHNYLNDFPDGNIEVAVKAIVFDNKIGAKEINSNEFIPDIVVFQKLKVDDLTIQDALAIGKSANDWVFSKDWKNNKNYILYNGKHKDEPINKLKNGVVINQANENHTGVSIILPCEESEENEGIMHNIFLNEQIISEKGDLTKLFNSIFKTIPFLRNDEDVIKLRGERVTRNKKFKADDLSIYIGEQLVKVLELHSANTFSSHDRLREMVRKNNFCSKTIDVQTIMPSDYQFIGFNDIRKNVDNISHINDTLDQYPLKGHRYVKWEFEVLASKINLLKLGIIALKSNIGEYSIKSSSFDKILAHFDANNLPKETVQVDFKNPSFYKTTTQNLSSADFQIIDTATDKLVNFSTGSPTYIHCLVKKEADMDRTSFKMVLDSADKESKKLFPQNNNMKFTIKLPERMEFHEDWNVCLKTLFIPSRLNNIYSEKCWMDFKGADDNVIRKWDFPLHLRNGHYERERDLAVEIGTMMREKDKPFKVNIGRSGRPVFTSKLARVSIIFSPYLAHILGFTANLQDSPFKLNFLQKGARHSPTFPPNIMALLPRNLIVCCDVVDDTLFAGQHVKLLRLVTNSASSNASSFTSFDFLQDEKFILKVKDFVTIEINVLDVTGDVVLSDSLLPTQLQLEFVREGLN